MAFYCKPSGRYDLGTVEATNNIQEYYNLFSGFTTVENVVGQLCNVNSESGLNPWRWQGDTVNLGAGYGLYQYTPASGYINLTGITGHSPNMSTSQVSGGDPSDAIAQIWVFQNNTLGKWVSSCWRSYWDPSVYPDLYNMRTRILNQYGDGSSLTLAQFYGIDNADDACFAFMACFEGPAVPNFAARIANAQQIRDAIGGGPTPSHDDILPILFLAKCLK